jgi:hypothetical protein
MKLAKLQIWGWIAALLFLIVFAVTYSYMSWQKRLFSLEKTKIDAENAQTQTRIDLLQEEVRALTSQQAHSDYLLPFFSSHQQIYEFFAASARRANLKVNRLSLRDGNENHLTIPVEIELAGDYPGVENFFERIRQRNFQFQLDRIELVQSPEPQENLRLIFTIFIPTQTEEFHG